MKFISLLGIFVILGLLFALSRDRKAISWRLVVTGLVIQASLGGIFLAWPYGQSLLYDLGEGVKNFLALSSEGTLFMFGGLADFKLVEGALTANPGEAYEGARQAFIGGNKRDLGFVFATQVLPTLIFFSSLMGVLYHLGVMQRIVAVMARVMAKVMGTSGAESLSACGNVFVGQTEAPLMVKPYLDRMTMSEIHAIMTGGYCTIAGGVFALYVLYGVEPGHLMVASVMAVPAGLICTKMLWPETEVSETMGKVVRTPKSESGSVVEAASNGAIDGLRLALNVGAMLIAFLSLVAVMNWLLGMGSDGIDYVATRWVGADAPQLELSLQRLLGWIFFPIAAVMGVPGNEISTLSELLGQKIVLTELIAYKDLGSRIDAKTISPRTAMIASFALCGFANLGSVAIQIGGLGAMSEARRGDIARLAVRAMWAGALATCLTACFAGLLGTEEVPA